MNLFAAHSKAPSHRVLNLLVVIIFGVTVSAILTGCQDDNNRVPTQTEIKAADTNRQAFIDKLNIPEDQKAQMKARMGGPSAANPADAARAGKAPSGTRKE